MSSALDVMNALTLEDGRRWGEAAEPWQREDAVAVLDRQGPPYHFLTRGRGGAKTSDLAGLGVAAMLTQAPAGSRLHAAAADRDQGRLFVDSVLGYQARTPELQGALRVDAYRVTATRRDVTLDVVAADAASSWGLRPWLLLLDEICQWGSTTGPRMFFESLTSAAAKFADARMVLLSSAGDPAHWTRAVLEHALRSALWRVHEVAGPVPWLDPARLEEQRERLPDSSYRRLFLNEWTAAEDRLVDPDDLAACVTLDGPLAPETGRSYVVGLDVGIRHDATVAAVCHLDANACVVVDRLGVWKPTKGRTVELGEVQAWLEETCRLYNRARVVFDPYQAIQLSQGLRSAGVVTHEFVFSAQSVGRLAINLHQVVRERRLVLPDDPDLLEELANVRLRETSPGVLRLDHDPDKHDDHAVALGLAALELTRNAGGGKVVSKYGHQGWIFDPSTGEYASIEEPVTRRGDLTFRGDKYVDKPAPDSVEWAIIK